MPAEAAYAGKVASSVRRALAVVPAPVKLRVVRIVGLAVAALGGLLWLLRDVPLLQVGLGALIVLLGGYAGWCRWPRWRWGIARASLSELAQPSDQLVRLTFDDGPTLGVTDQVLDALREHGVKASFFVLVQKAAAQPDLVRRMLAEGHIVGLHGQDHRLPFFRRSAELQASLGTARKELEALCGQPIALYRPSHGFKNVALVRAVAALRLRLCFWDYGVWDTDAPPWDVLLARLRATLPVRTRRDVSVRKPGPVVLLHDGLGDDPGIPAHAEPMLAALRAFLPLLRTKLEPAQDHKL